jgi:lincosamide nucleotidyltransferase
VLPQEAMIKRAREVCRADERLVGALMYGSFAQGEGDAYSDIEFALFFDDEELPGIDQRAWVGQIAPVARYFVNEFGNGTAIFLHDAELIRGEFHFDPASAIPMIETWRETDTFVSLDATLILDRTGDLTKSLRTLVGPPPRRDEPAQVQALCDRFVNWMLFGANVLDRGELARALDILSHAHRYLLWMVRLVEGATGHWPTPSRALELDISPAAYARFAACTATLDEASLRDAYWAAWSWGRELMASLAERYDVDLSEILLDRMDRRLMQGFDGAGEQNPGSSV